MTTKKARKEKPVKRGRGRPATGAGRNVIVRAMPEQREAWEKSADREGMGLSAWIRAKLDGTTAESPELITFLPPACIEFDENCPIEDGPYVYFLVLNGKCVYVGQTINFKQRLRGHLKTKQFDRAFYMKVDDDSRLNVEREWISKLSPEGNKGPGRPAVGKVRSIKASDSDWEAWQEAAELIGLDRSAFIRETMDREASKVIRQNTREQVSGI